MQVAFHAGVDDHQFAGLHHFVVQVVVQGFAVLGEDGGEGNAPALGQRNAFHFAHDILFHNAQGDGIPCCRMHFIAQITRGVNRFNFNGFLEKTHGDDGFRERAGDAFRHLLPAHQFHQAQGVEIARRIQVMDVPAGLAGGVNVFVHLGVRQVTAHAAGLGLGGYAGLRAHPDDIVNVNIIRVKRLLAGVDVQRGGHQRFVQAEEIQPGAVLAPFIAIVFVLGGGFGVADKKNETMLPGGLHFLQQLLPAADIDFFLEHSSWME